MTQRENKGKTIVPDIKSDPTEPEARRIGQGTRHSDASEGVKAEISTDKNTKVSGDPNQGIDARQTAVKGACFATTLSY